MDPRSLVRARLTPVETLMVRFGVIAETRFATYYVAAGERSGGAASGDIPFRRERSRILVRLIDDRFLFAESLATAVHASTPDIVVEHLTSKDALNDLPGVVQDAGVILVSLGRSGLTGGEMGKVLLSLLALEGHPPIAALVQKARRPLVRKALDLGLKGFVPTSAPLSVAIGAIRLIQSGGTFIPDP